MTQNVLLEITEDMVGIRLEQDPDVPNMFRLTYAESCSCPIQLRVSEESSHVAIFPAVQVFRELQQAIGVLLPMVSAYKKARDNDVPVWEEGQSFPPMRMTLTSSQCSSTPPLRGS